MLALCEGFPNIQVKKNVIITIFKNLCNTNINIWIYVREFTIANDCSCAVKRTVKMSESTSLNIRLGMLCHGLIIFTEKEYLK